MFRPIIYKRGTIAKGPIHTTGFTHNRFYQLPNRHPRWNGMGINNDVGPYTTCGVRHVFFGYNYAEGALLATSTRKFISNRRHALVSYSDFRNSKPFFAFRYKRFIDKADLAFFRKRG